MSQGTRQRQGLLWGCISHGPGFLGSRDLDSPPNAGPLLLVSGSGQAQGWRAEMSRAPGLGQEGCFGGWLTPHSALAWLPAPGRDLPLGCSKHLPGMFTMSVPVSMAASFLPAGSTLGAWGCPPKEGEHWRGFPADGALPCSPTPAGHALTWRLRSVSFLQAARPAEDAAVRGCLLPTRLPCYGRPWAQLGRSTIAVAPGSRSAPHSRPARAGPGPRSRSTSSPSGGWRGSM